MMRYTLLLTCLLLTAPSSAEPPQRELEFGGGFLIDEPIAEAYETAASVVMQLRAFIGRTFFLSLMGAAEPLVDARNVEQIELSPALRLGAGAGLSLPLSDAWSAYGSLGAEWTYVWNWRGESPPRRDLADGLHLTPLVGLTWWFMEAWGHPMGIELQGTYGWYYLDGGWYRSIQVGLMISGVLLPEPATW